MKPTVILSNLRIQDVLDILFLALIAYYLYRWFWGTKAFKALVGLLGLGIIYSVARSWGLFLTTWVFQILWQVLIILLIILFQSEIRQVLERINPLRVLGLRGYSRTEEWIPGFSETMFSLARRRIGALVILERSDRVDELTTGGIPLEGEPNAQLLMAIFQKESPLHDGAVLIRAGQVAQVGCYLPLTSKEDLPKEWGTRHRAGLGLSERCDAWVVVVSEERGEVCVARNGEMTHSEGTGHLSALVREAVAGPAQVHANWWRKGIAVLTQRWHLKLGSIAMVAFVWFLLAGQQNFEVTLQIPLKMKNLPEQMEIVEPPAPKVKLVLRGLRKDASTLNEGNVEAVVDLSLAELGRRTFRITRDNIRLPNERIAIVKIEPSQIKFDMRAKKKSNVSK